MAQARAVAESLCTLLAPNCLRVVIVGSIRREKPTVGDIELLILPKTEMRPDERNAKDAERHKLTHARLKTL